MFLFLPLLVTRLRSNVMVRDQTVDHCRPSPVLALNVVLREKGTSCAADDSCFCAWLSRDLFCDCSCQRELRRWTPTGREPVFVTQGKRLSLPQCGAHLCRGREDVCTPALWIRQKESKVLLSLNSSLQL